MASFDTAFEWMMNNEDAPRAYKLVPDDPPGAHAISGVNSSAFPHAFEVIASLPQAERGSSIKDFYHLNFWNTWFDQLASDEVAKRLFDASVNMGAGTALKLLQEATETVTSAPMVVDGHWGPMTLRGANNCDPDLLFQAFRTARVQHYREIVVKNPAKAKFLETWIARAGK